MEDEYVDRLEQEVLDNIRLSAEGDLEEEYILIEQAKKDPILRDFFKHPGTFSLTSSGPDFSKIFTEAEQKKPPR
ncbi:MAG: hypothetical protein Q8Q24_02525 [bacterium]|nr:hypothetical protein [bacterium]